MLNTFMLEHTAKSKWSFSSQGLPLPKIWRNASTTLWTILLTEKPRNRSKTWKKHNLLCGGKT